MPWLWLRTHDSAGRRGRLVYLSQRWQVVLYGRWWLAAWRVPGFGAGVRLGPVDVVRLPRMDR